MTSLQYVGMTRFELAASSSRTKRATGLRYIPNPIFSDCKNTTFFIIYYFFLKNLSQISQKTQNLFSSIYFHGDLVR